MRKQNVLFIKQVIVPKKSPMTSPRRVGKRLRTPRQPVRERLPEVQPYRPVGHM